MNHPFTASELLGLQLGGVAVDVLAAEPNIKIIADQIAAREKRRPEHEQRSRLVLNRHVFSGFGAERGLKTMVPECVINNDGVIDIKDTSFPKLMNDIQLRDVKIAVKSADENTPKNRGAWWISEAQCRSLCDSVKFNDLLFVMGFTSNESNPAVFYYSPLYLIDFKAFMLDFNFYARKTQYSYSALFDAKLAIANDICISLRNT